MVRYWADCAARLRRSRALAKKFARDGRATTAVEFSLVALPLIALLFAALQTAVVLMAEQELETAVEESGRLVMTNQVSSTTMTQAQFTQAVCKYLVTLFNCGNLIVNVQTADSFADVSTSAPSYQTLQNNQWTYNTGSPGDVVVMQVMYEWPIFGSLLGYNLANLPNGDRLLMSTAVFRNEP